MTKLITSELGLALMGNVNNNIFNVSFDYHESNIVEVQFILIVKTSIEEELIDEILFEFEAVHGNFKEFSWYVYLIDDMITPLQNVVFQKWSGNTSRCR